MRCCFCDMKQTIYFTNPAYVVSAYSIVGQEEKKGPFGDYFDEVMDSQEWGESSFEKTELKMHKTALKRAIKGADLEENEVQAIIGGDLLNQIISAGYSAREFESVFLGVYSACSTYAESMIVGSLLVSGQHMRNVACATSSHFSSAERQYRFPLELGTPRTPLSQWTVTGAGAVVLSNLPKGQNCPKIVSATLGKILDYGIKDANNMGAAMAPAAADTLIQHFLDTGRTPSDYDCIISGDLGKYGSSVFKHLLKSEGYLLGSNYFDCGAEIFGEDKKKFQGGSGAGCGTTVFNSYVYSKLRRGDFKRVLFMPTGALMSKVSSLQGESIPAIAHAVTLEV